MSNEDLPLTTGELNLDTVSRKEPHLLQRLAGDASVRVLTVRGTDVVTTDDATGPHLQTLPASDLDPSDLPVSDLPASGPPASGPPASDLPASDLPGQNDGALWAYLGTAGECTYLARLLPAPGDNGQQLPSLRSVGQFLPETEAALATTAVALANWHRRHTHCPGCGRPTEVVEAGWVRRCPAEGTDHFPRTDPAVIMAITDPDDRLLLARSAHWPQGRFSVPAGFVEPGESLEQAVRREVGEETTIRVQDVTYRGTQPWPFPGSLMCGFTGTTTDTAPHPDGAEIAEARFFTRAELNLHWQSGSIRPPGAISIAHALISQWFGGPIPSPSTTPTTSSTASVTGTCQNRR